MSINQKSLAAALGIAPATVSKWKKAGMPVHDVAAAKAWRDKNVSPYIRCERPAPPMASATALPTAERTAPPPPAAGDVAPLDLAQERAMLAREQRIAIELKNQTARGEFAPIALLAEVLATASQSVVDRLDQLPGRLRRACPLLPEKARAEVLDVIGQARNEWIHATLELVAAKLQTGDDDDDPMTGDPLGAA
jgi:phage terminase Nu1 subunit (DNA packaging protein)